VKQCPFCSETVQDAAIICKHCKSTLPADAPQGWVCSCGTRNAADALSCSACVQPAAIGRPLVAAMATAPGSPAIAYADPLGRPLHAYRETSAIPEGSPTVRKGWIAGWLVALLLAWPLGGAVMWSFGRRARILGEAGADKLESTGKVLVFVGATLFVVGVALIVSQVIAASSSPPPYPY
jgi:hypothetical protein